MTDVPVGWKCPTCGKGNSPWTAACQHCLIVVTPDMGGVMISQPIPHLETKDKGLSG